jgi:shikimate kinase
MKQHLYLTGYRGTGKTSVGVILARALACPIIDLDLVITANAGKSIREIFEQGGESRFRDLESEALATVAAAAPAVISLGGGAVLRPGNRQIIRQTGVCYWLDADAETIASRIQADTQTASQRPALTNLSGLDEIRQLLAVRQEFYQEVANHRIDTAGKSIAEVADCILNLQSVGQ